MIDKLDKTDIEILRLLQQNSNRTIKNIADVLGMTTTPIFDRIKKLEKKGFIDKYAAILNSRMLGLKLTVFVGITLKNHNRSYLEKFVTTIKGFTEVVECHRVSGNFDYLLKLTLVDIEDYAAAHSKMEDDVSQRLKEPDSNLQILPESSSSHAVHPFGNKLFSNSVTDFVEESLEQTQKELRSNSTFNSGEGEEELTKALKKRPKKIKKDIAKKRNIGKKPRNDDNSAISSGKRKRTPDDDHDGEVNHDGKERQPKKKLRKVLGKVRK